MNKSLFLIGFILELINSIAYNFSIFTPSVFKKYLASELKVQRYKDQGV